MNNGYVIETEALTKRYGALEAVRALDLRVESHGITGFLGRNGAESESTSCSASLSSRGAGLRFSRAAPSARASGRISSG